MSKRAPLVFDRGKALPVAVEKIGFRENEKTNKRESKKTKNGREGRQFIAAHVLPEAAKQFKLIAVQKDMTTQDLLIEAINDLFVKNGLSRIA